MSKTGSSSLKKSFLNLTDNVAQIHMINGKKQLRSYIQENMIEYIKKNNHKKFLIINIFRCPIQRKLSLYFYKRRKERYVNNYKLQQDIHNYILSKNNEWILNKNKNDTFVDHCDHPNYEWNKHFNYNYYSKPFDFNKKYISHKQDNLIFLNLRFKDINEWDNIINNFFSEYNLFDNKKFKLLEDEKTKKFNEKMINIHIHYKNNINFCNKHFKLIYDYYKNDLLYFYSKKEIEEWVNKYNKI